MAWSTPLTAVSNATLTAAQWNASVRDNLLETGPAKATTAGRIIVTTGANAVTERAVLNDAITTAQTSASTSFTDLTTVGPTVTLTSGVGALVAVTSTQSDSTSGTNVYTSYAVSGATTIAATDDRSVFISQGVASMAMRASAVSLETALTAGSNTFTTKYRVTAGTGTWSNRQIVVIGL